MTRISSAIAAALIASASFGTAALAEGDYYQGVQNAPAASAAVDRISTGSISQNDKVQADVSSGDYFDGANRPN
ncbi:DUF680 domain-containing protein [Neorhizobium galegae]|uniref:DUF680 domain-containing protein n=1 Tax=Neorhizobium galegae TaxID=399 RepID=UPI00062233C4|nr:DUF680 domain-containing protein [Neorhizobium galegae]CDZ28226.1 Hypothetical protein NGAL_HAMBI490_30840 [Neorhizobium galegae bv. officinalis]KAA9388008.1 DUF680 domain-containing protein [Neorhizobium galegae]KAB1115530.1 DUF680 domain-containing protein [Neorhizobium galegae]MCM2501148.1 DUF680 domain-containing protein [Neorhizobium galegae]MCQ1773433.1 DUF680 domain-containing protein [Neorhizobium galegae]